MGEKISGAEATIRMLLKHGINLSWGITGGAIIPFFDSMLSHQKDFRHITTRHEQGAAHAAEGYARAIGKPGFCVATSGPGATNLVTGIADAYLDSVPIIAMAGQVSTNLIGNDAFQEADLMGITMPITKHNFQPRKAEEIPEVIEKAYRISIEGRPGPVYIDLPKDVQTQTLDSDLLKREYRLAHKKITLEGNPKQVAKAAEELLNAERPVVILGGGAVHANAAREALELAELLNVPVATTLMAKGIFPETHPLSLGCLGMHGTKSANYAVINADVLVGIGNRFDDRITGNLVTFGKQAKIIHIDIDPAEISKNVETFVPIVGDAKTVLKQLVLEIRRLKKSPKNAWFKKLEGIMKIEAREDIAIGKDDPVIHPVQAMQVLDKVLAEGDIVVTGVGQHQMFGMHYLKRSKPRTFISSGGLGTMGFGLPAAMGAKMAKPDVNVFNLDGDGSFQMTLQELATMKLEGINTVSVILNNGTLGMVHQWLDLFYDSRQSQTHLRKCPDFVKLAEAYGLNGIRVERLSELEPALRQALKNDEATIIDVVVFNAHCLPMFPSGGNLTDFFGGTVSKSLEWFPGVVKGKDLGAK